MATKTKLEVSSFTKGLITEAGPLTFPENASLVDENMVLNKDGSRQRRLGLNIEEGATEYTYTGDVTGTNKPQISMHLWKNPTKTGSFDIVVVQTSEYLKFYKADSTSIDANPLHSGAALLIPNYDVEFRIVTASLLGQLVIAYGYTSVYILTYDEVTDTVTGESSNLNIRDIYGVATSTLLDYQSGLAVVPYKVDFRPGTPDPITASDTSSLIHMYNLRNQGWPTITNESVNQDGSGNPTDGDPTQLDTDAPGNPHLRPSDADVFWRYRVTAADSPSCIGAYSHWEVYKERNVGTSPAPRGQCILDVFDRSGSRQDYYDEKTGDPTLILPVDTSTGQISQVGTFAGRYFYAVKELTRTGGDERTPRIGNFVFFSQVIKSTAQVGKCYQEADPTAENLFEVVDTDGGFISLPEAGEILKLVPLGSSLFVFATNGVWEIFGGESGFSATNQNVIKTTSIGALSTTSIVVSESVLTYWANSGIILINMDATTNHGIATNITITTIQSLYNAIPLVEKKRAIGVFDEINRKIRWLYTNTTRDWPPIFDRELIFDADLQAFYTNVILDDLFTYAYVDVIAVPDIRYLVGRYLGVGSIKYTFAYYRDTTFYDFEDNDSPAILLTGYLTGGASSSNKQIGKLVTHLKRTETGFEEDGDSIVFSNPSGCMVQAQWEWTSSPTAGKWGAAMQMYRLQRPYYPSGVEDPFDYGYTVITSRSGIRGRGRALSLLFESEPGKDMHILGWGLEVTVEDKY